MRESQDQVPHDANKMHMTERQALIKLDSKQLQMKKKRKKK